MTTSLDQNIHLLLPKGDLQTLRRYAKLEKTSVAELIRRAIKSVYGGAEPNQKKQAFETLLRHSDLQMEDWSVVKRDLLKRYE